jgi:hypothetical protein
MTPIASWLGPALVAAAFVLTPMHTATGQSGEPAAFDGSGPLSKEVILGHLRAHLGPDRGTWQRRDQVNQRLVEAIKQRGVDFIVTDSGELTEAGGDSSLWYAVKNNPGRPAARSFLFGTWDLMIVGQGTHTTDGVTTHTASAGRTGFFTIDADGTYVWSKSATRIFRGKWRAATSQEMGTHGGEGLVLLGAHEGKDWIVYKRTAQTLRDEVVITQPEALYRYEYGQRRK